MQSFGAAVDSEILESWSRNVLTYVRYLSVIRLSPPSYAISAVCLSFCLPFCHSVCRITAKVISRFHWNLVLWLAYQSVELINFGGDLISDMDSGSLLHIFQHCGTGDIRRFISISHTVTGRFSRHSANADKILNPQHLRSHTADIQIRIRMNPEIRIRIPDYF